MNERCKFVDNSDNSIQGCKFKCNYGDYCYKHRREFLIVNDEILRDRFTGLSKDYLKNDLVKYLKNKMRRKSIIHGKEELFQEISKHIITINGYHEIDHTNEITKIQSLFRGKMIRDKNKGLKCNNDEDFYTYDELKTVPKQYFYSYVDNSNIRWGFDIRSLDKLIIMGFGNPYGDPWSVDIVGEWTHKLVDMGIKILSLSDTVGVASGKSISYLFSHLIPLYPHIEFGAHLHTTPTTWFEKIDAAYKAGCKRFDGAIKGFGGCPMAKDELTGNMPTEKLLSYFTHQKVDPNMNPLAFESAYNKALRVF